MKNLMESTKNNKSKWVKLAAGFVGVTVIGAFILQSQTTANASNQQLTPPTVTLEKTELTKTLSASGVVKSSSTTNIYSTLSNPVQEIYVSVGDRVKAGDVLAQLDMSKLENDISQAAINLKSAQNSAAEEVRSNSNSVTSALTSLESSRISLERQELNIANAEKDLSEAEINMEKPFDSYTYDRAIDDARINLERKTLDFETAEKELEEARNDFDDYSYQNAINEAKITLERRISDLDDKSFDEYSYKNAINDAEKNLKRKKDDEETAKNNYYDALNRYFEATPETQSSAWSSVTSAQTSMESARRAVEDAESALNRAKTDLTRARDDFNTSNAENSVDDAQRAYDKALADLERAKRDAKKNANDNLEKVNNSLVDARRAYEKALSDKERAIQDYLDNNLTKLENSQKTLADSQNQLQSAEISLQSAQNSLKQATGKSAASGANVEIQTLNLEKLESQLAEGMIIATADGVVTEINVQVGAVPNGVVFVIEDVDNLYVSANVKEYSLSDLKLGQSGLVTTEATAEREYEAEVTYISPKAVSPAGSTSVEFEVQASMKSNDMDIKIGMNAFLNVITETKTDVYVVPLSAVVTDERGSFVYALENNEQMEIAVSVGIKTSTQAEIYGNDLYDGLLVLRNGGY